MAGSKDDSNGESTLSQEFKLSYTSDGRYIPYQGGSMGWADNAGVMKSEVGNHYKYHTMMENAEVKTAQFFRAGAEFGQRRATPRQMIEIPAILQFEDGSLTCLTHDISQHGVRLQFIEETSLYKGLQVTVQLLNQEATVSLMAILSEVVWIRSSGVTRTVWSVGISFTGLTPDQDTQLKAIIEP